MDSKDLANPKDKEPAFSGQRPGQKDKEQGRNELKPDSPAVGTNTEEELNKDNSPEVIDALKESQI